MLEVKVLGDQKYWERKFWEIRNTESESFGRLEMLEGKVLEVNTKEYVIIEGNKYKLNSNEILSQKFPSNEALRAKLSPY